MDNNQKNPTQSRRFSILLTIGTLVLTVGILYWGREVMMPLALAVLVSFILSPIVRFFQRKGLGPRLSVALTMIVAFLLVGGTGMLILGEFRTLANELPEYQQNIRKRIADVHFVLKTGSFGKVQNTVKEVVNELKKEDPPATKSAPPVSVVVKETGGALDFTMLKPLFSPLVTAGLVVVLVIFMLLRREDLRDRV
jgi:predicted PurR-regulated permease PerM